MQISPEVKDAIESGEPVVALESTVIAHGLPYPANLETALTLEEVIRKHGVVPATIAVIRGDIRVGLSHSEIEFLSTDKAVLKLGTRDLPSAVPSGRTGATTVSATSFIASKAGIGVFVTGGIGGVHRGAGRTLDISSDLWGLAGSSIIVVCAGAKAVLDLPATMEWLETHQIPVLGYRTDEFPGFYTAKTGLIVERVETPEDAAQRFVMQRKLGMRGALIVGARVPSEHDLDLSREIDQALGEMSRAGIAGKAVTPWLLARLEALTGGASVTTNIALLRNNASIGAKIARAAAPHLWDKRVFQDLY